MSDSLLIEVWATMDAHEMSAINTYTLLGGIQDGAKVIDRLRAEVARLKAFVDDVKTVMRMSIHNVNFMKERRKEAFQMQGRYDGAMLDGCRKLYELEYKVFDELIGEHVDSEEE